MDATDTDKLTALEGLLAEIEAGTVAPFAPLAESMVDNFSQQEIDLIQRANHGSLDAAKSLHEAVLDGWAWDLNRLSCKLVRDGYAPEYGQRTTSPARAWLIAILRALIAQERGQ